MKVTWLHVSDFHIRGGDPYDRDVVLRALVSSVRELREDGRVPDLIFATGDVAHAGKPAEYEIATHFFDALLDATGLDRRHLFVIPGNHDVDRDLGIGLARTLESREKADAYFRPGIPKPHLTQKLGAFRNWYKEYFAGIRVLPEDSTCGPVEALEIRGCRIGVLPLNTALFCEDDYDQAKLCIGRRCLDAGLEELGKLGAHLKVALLHHPLDWLSDIERSNIKTSLQGNVDVLLRGHLHETEVESVVSANGEALHIAAGAVYQTRKWPNRALYATFEDRHITIFPIRYEDQPSEVWTVDPSLFPRERGYEKRFPLKRAEVEKNPAVPTKLSEPMVLPRFPSNVPSRRDLPFVGREQLLADVQTALGEPKSERVLVLHGQPGVGKSELAREYARHQRDWYPGGTFIIDAGSGAMPVDLARVGVNVLDLEFPPDLSLQDQCVQTLLSLGAAPVLLIYDNARSPDSIQPWLPPAGMPCHVLITTVLDRWGPGWSTMEVEAFDLETSVELIEQLAGSEVAARHGQALADLAGGLPVQICPAATTLAYEARRGRLDSVRLEIADEARESFRLVYERLEPPVHLLLHAAAFLNGQRIPRQELYQHLKEATGWSEADFQRLLDTCLDLHLLDGDVDLRMHQLLSSFVLGTPLVDGNSAILEQVRVTQRKRLLELAKELGEHPANSELATTLMVFRLRPQDWGGAQAEISVNDGEIVGKALLEIGKFEEARLWYEWVVEAGSVNNENLSTSLYGVGVCLSRVGKFEEALLWFERAVEVDKQGDLSGHVNQSRLGSSLSGVGFCLCNAGQFKEALPWHERAVEAKKQGDLDGRVDQGSLGWSQHQVGVCLESVGKFEEARSWYEQALEAKKQGDLSGRSDHANLSTSLYGIGFCLSIVGKFEEARSWYERAVEANQQGDLHGRVHHDILGRTLHQVGFCLSSVGKFEEALPWYEWAVEATRQGDIYGRVDSSSLALSLREGAKCLRHLNQLEKAQAWENEADELEAASRQN